MIWGTAPWLSLGMLSLRYLWTRVYRNLELRGEICARHTNASHWRTGVPHLEQLRSRGFVAPSEGSPTLLREWNILPVKPANPLTAPAKALCRLHGSLVSREDGDSAPNSGLDLCKVFITYVQEHSRSPKNVATPVTCTLVNTHAHTSPLQQKWPKLCEVRMSLEMISFACFKSALVCTACSSKFTLQKADSFFHILFT